MAIQSTELIPISPDDFADWLIDHGCTYEELPKAIAVRDDAIRAEERARLSRWVSHSPHCAQNRWPEKGGFDACDCGLDRARASSSAKPRIEPAAGSAPGEGGE